ncbi:MAG: hypothetical protein AAB817_02065 [Patescibacteria group bacterium]
MADDILNNLDAIPIRDPRGHFSLLDPTPPASQPAGGWSADEQRWQELESAIKKLSLPITDELLNRRLKNAVLADWKGIRTSWQTKELLVRETVSGGVGLSESAAGAILTLIDKTESSATDAPGPSTPPRPLPRFTPTELAHELMPPPPAVRPAAVDRTVQILTSRPPARPPRPTSQPVSPPVASLRPQPPATSQPFISQPLPTAGAAKAANWLGRLTKRFQRPAKAMSPTTASPGPSRPLAPRADKFTDIRPGVRLVGPIEELRQFRLVDWHALDANPARAAEKIKGKIDLLEREGWPKRVAAIAAWQASEVHRLYLAVGKDSVETGQPLPAVLATRAAARQPTLTAAEFAALAKLNNVLE